MDGEVFAYDGKLGRWSCVFVLTQAPPDAFGGTAEISFDGKVRCKVVLTMPLMTHAEGVAALKQKCIAWIQAAEVDKTRLRMPESSHG